MYYVLQKIDLYNDFTCFDGMFHEDFVALFSSADSDQLLASAWPT